MTASRRTRLYASLLVMAASTPPSSALPPAPFNEIVDIVRELVADQLGRKTTDVNTLTSLAAQGCTEKDLLALVIAIDQEFGVVIPDSELQQGRWNDPTPPMSVHRLADMVYRQIQARP